LQGTDRHGLQVRASGSRNLREGFRHVGFLPRSSREVSDTSDFFREAPGKFPTRRISSAKLAGRLSSRRISCRKLREGYLRVGFLAGSSGKVSDTSDFLPEVSGKVSDASDFSPEAPGRFPTRQISCRKLREEIRHILLLAATCGVGTVTGYLFNKHKKYIYE
jgi:hypothetical protein